jgi:hypothetical protein
MSTVVGATGKLTKPDFLIPPGRLPAYMRPMYGYIRPNRTANVWSPNPNPRPQPRPAYGVVTKYGGIPVNRWPVQYGIAPSPRSPYDVQINTPTGIGFVDSRWKH